jgi:hypothetical protein
MIGTATIKDGPMTGTAAVDSVKAFKLRCEARALLWRLGELELQDAVDVLQADAVFDGLVDQLGQDAVQEIMARVFGDTP